MSEGTGEVQRFVLKHVWALELVLRHVFETRWLAR